MSEWQLVIGNKNYSSWSLRAYLVLRQTGAAFDEVLIPLDQPDTRARLRELSPSGLVPVLRGPLGAVWESLAIAEHLAEQFPAAGLWPSDPRERARARSISAEMHAGFAALRRHLPMDIRARRPLSPPAEVRAQIDRITEIWRSCREQYGAGGPFLFGESFTVADAMYAPVVTRFRTYGVDLDPVCGAYAEAVWEHPPLQEWAAAARDEPWHIEYS